MNTVWLYMIALILMLRSSIDNDALRQCARELKRIGDALTRPEVQARPDSSAAAAQDRSRPVVSELKRIADAQERIRDSAERDEKGRL